MWSLLQAEEILRPEDEELWLSSGVGTKQLADLLKPYDPDSMEANQVSRLVNNPANESPMLIERAV